MKKSVCVVVSSVAAAAMFSGCANRGIATGESAEIEGVVWEMTRYASIDGEMEARVEKSMVNLRISEGEASGNAGANRFSGQVKLHGAEIEITTVSSTMMMGTPELMAQESRFLTALGEVETYDIVEDELFMKGAEGAVVLVFKPRVEPALVGTEWKATGVNNGSGGVASWAGAPELSSVFSVDGRVAGTSGCNRYSGGFFAEGEGIEISKLMGTRMACPEDVMKREREFLDAMERARVFSIYENVLELRDEEGALQVRFLPD